MDDNLNRTSQSAGDAATHRLALNVMQLMHGLSILEIEFLLQEVRRLVKITSHLDVTSPHHRKLIEFHNETFGAEVSAPTRQ